eukprot:526436-Alexandrium_andersonii.AAC.1
MCIRDSRRRPPAPAAALCRRSGFPLTSTARRWTAGSQLPSRPLLRWSRSSTRPAASWMFRPMNGSCSHARAPCWT